ncbi:MULTISPECIES: ribosome hibernation-promoting factor, HPF/YfiA family [Campylobacter]|uniref:Ribosome hibernation promoting factor n=1 Tax=Campylobacter porcelli TaxID=1660073 RepID=A0A1X9SWL7_9BACT|nr:MULTISPECIES: ribosome-associated translation inhibitor RaiA [unclassified Campylobacter]ARR00631.1 translation inhibitor protein RaiA [Campylobacter sp. RM6137]MCR8695828.1 ribosome-associated translation inhibitor RaiA [Campylobacter sp. RM19073]MEE3743817.1 ribosome-associated translation inhibitor RaiA [Campylobacter sp. CX2-4855-23]MEE3776076.1 ribosome-associated translation inhibitor RaiA [Campylobacter sp. CX2-4080-23]
MNTSIVGKQFELTESIKNYCDSAFDALGKYNLDIISAKAIISADERNGKKGFDVEFAINLAKKDTIVIRQKDKDLYAAIDLALDRASKVLRRHHDKLVTHKNSDEIKESKIADEIAIDGADEIVPTELELYKPMEIEEALNKLKDSGAQFYVFNDMDAKMRVIYKRNDGKFGLY